MTKLASEDVAKLFTVPEAHWTAIDKRVGLAIRVEAIGAEMQKTMPSYPALLGTSYRWKSSTFPGVVSQSAAVSHYAADQIQAFSLLRDEIAALPPSTQVVPAPLAYLAREALRRLHEATAVQAGTAAALSKPIDDFRIVNDAVDTDIARMPIRSWPSVAAQTHAVAQGISHVEGTWSALVTDLQAMTNDGVAITMPFLMGLEIDVALASWRRIRTESTAFGSMAAGQQQYLDGRIS
jgi:hypothetical protein